MTFSDCTAIVQAQWPCPTCGKKVIQSETVKQAVEFVCATAARLGDKIRERNPLCRTCQKKQAEDAR